MQTKLITIGVLVLGASALGGVFLFMDAEESTTEGIVSDGAQYAIATDQMVGERTFEPIEVEEVQQRTPAQRNNGGGNEGWSNFAARMAQFDADGDGFLSDEERKAMMEARRAEWRDKMDLDGDGEISRDERMAARQARFDNSDRGQELMRRFDLDGDGVLNENEQAALDAYNDEQRQVKRDEQLAQYDRDGDGEISQEERQVQRDEQRAQWEDIKQQATIDFDLDGDGVLNIEEQQNAIDAYLEQREIDQFINRYDTDGDGRMSGADYDSFVNDYNTGDLGADVNRDGIVDLQDLIAYRDLVTRSGD